jgi:hypothetical protein
MLVLALRLVLVYCSIVLLDYIKGGKFFFGTPLHYAKGVSRRAKKSWRL